MKNKLHQSITILIALLVLLSSTGFVLTERQCAVMGSKSMQLIGKSKENFSKPKVTSSCCAKRAAALKMAKGTFFEKAACCKESKKLEKLEVASVHSQLLAKLLKSVATAVTWSVTRYQFIQAEWTLPSAPFSPDISFSSRLHGRSMLAFIQSFLI
ncbi:MAG: hypothetical protein J7619_28915 [Dyadobacter sp.]|uniref:hypothetical protein n=1 Tax=Dyadobacter sp. TaxID=1914288 RepID=UPI001B1EFF6B|nr:hypothetical protein [Dyadobacter sp.]MBO9616743.1 hypothetical protein [Dyadobacter sp.]